MKKMVFLTVVITTLMMLFTIQGSAADIIKGSKSEIEVTNADSGYVTVKFTGEGTQKLKLIIEKDSEKYTYDLNNTGKAESYPLQLGNGTYKIRVMQNTTGTKYAEIQNASVKVTLKDSFVPYLASTQFIVFDKNSTAAKTAAEVTKGASAQLEKVDAIYAYVAKLLTYDTQKAATVSSGYAPNLEEIFKAKKGICFDYASMMAAMLRSQGIPTKLVMGYVSPDNLYHAWNEVYIDGVGWIETGKMYFDGKTWQLMDPTFLSATNGNDKIIEYIGNNGNYAKKYEY